MATTFYGIGFNEAAQDYALSVTPTNCTVSHLTPIATALTPALGEPYRIQITATSSSPSVIIQCSTALAGKITRAVGLLGVKIVSAGVLGVYVGTTANSTAHIINRTTATNVIIAGEGNQQIQITPIGLIATNVVTIDIGRYWLSDMARVYGGPFEEWTDGGDDSGRMVETDGFQGIGYGLATRNVFEVPLSVVTEVDMYAGTGTTDVTYSPLKEALMHAGTHDQIIIGSFSEASAGAFVATSTPYGVDALTYCRLLEIPKIQRIGGPNYGCSLSVAELK